jgi:hypothetical protein
MVSGDCSRNGARGCEHYRAQDYQAADDRELPIHRAPPLAGSPASDTSRASPGSTVATGVHDQLCIHSVPPARFITAGNNRSQDRPCARKLPNHQRPPSPYSAIPGQLMPVCGTGRTPAGTLPLPTLLADPFFHHARSTSSTHTFHAPLHSGRRSLTNEHECAARTASAAWFAPQCPADSSVLAVPST